MTQPVDHTSSLQLAMVVQTQWCRLTNLGCVVGGAKNELRSAVVPGADVRHIGLLLHEDLGAAEIAQLQDAAVGVEQEVLGLDISVADALGVDIRQRPEELVSVELHLEDGHSRLQLVKESRSSVDRLGDKFLDEVEVDFVFLQDVSGGTVNI